MVSVIKRIKYRNLSDLFCIMSLPFLIFAFKFSGSSIIDIVVRAIIITLIGVFLGFMSYVLMTVKNL